MFAVNVKGYYWSTQAAIPHMLKAGKGSPCSSAASPRRIPRGASRTASSRRARWRSPTSARWSTPDHPLERGAVRLIADSPASRLLQTIPELIDPILADHPRCTARRRPRSLAEPPRIGPVERAINGETIVADGGQRRTQGNLNALMQKIRPLFAKNRISSGRTRTQNLAAVTPDDLMAAEGPPARP